MSRKIFSGILVSLLLLGIATLAFNILPVKAGTIIVPDHYLTIQEAINAANPGDTIYVRAGTYYENVVMNKTLSLVGESRESAIIDGNLTGTVVTITAGRVLVSNFTIRNSGEHWPYSGIRAEASHSNVINNNITNNNDGIFLYPFVSNNTISGNNITNSYSYGIWLDGPNYNNTISGNNITNNVYGILLQSSSNNIISGNNITNSYSYGIWLWGSSNNTISGNNITNENRGIYVYGSSNNTIYGNDITGNNQGIALQYSSNNTFISGNNITNNGQGIYLYYYSYNITISGNNITNNYYGIEIHPNSSDITISGNNITNNTWFGIVVHQSSNITIFGNLFVNDGLLMDGFYRNVVVDNLVNGKPLVYLEGVSHQSVGDAGQVILINCEYIQVEDQNLSHADVGIILWNTNNTLMSGNDITNNVYGILLQSSSNNIISGNNITNSYSYGIWLRDSSNYTISGNNITNSLMAGVLIEYSSHSNIVGNSIKNNEYYGIQVHGSADNTISGNSITANKRDGIWLHYHSSNNIIFGNSIKNNSNGISLSYSSNNNSIYHNNFIDNTKQALVSESYNNLWDDGYPSGGNYWSDYIGVDNFSGPGQDILGSDGIGDIPYVVYGSNRDNYPLTKPYSGSHDVGITSFATSKTGCLPMPTVGQGFSLNVTMNTLNYGINAETLNVTTHANSTAIQTFANVAMAGRNSTTLTFAWNTSGFEHGNYTMTAHAEPVLGETDLADNTFLCWIIITIPGDINGDFTLDIYDAIILANAYNSKTGGQYWNPNADINSDNIVDIYDAIILANHYNQHYP